MTPPTPSLCLLLVLSLLTPHISHAQKHHSTLEPLTSSPQFSGFALLLTQADLVPHLESTLCPPAPSACHVTIFAPTNEALLYHTSPTVLASLKHPQNRETLRKLLLSHILPTSPSPFQWEGVHTTLSGKGVPLSMDADSFYVGGVPVSQFNAVSGGGVTIHAVPRLLLSGETQTGEDSGLGLSGSQEMGMRRRVLQGLAPAPAPSPESAVGESGEQGMSTGTPKSARTGSVVSVLALVAAGVAAALL